MMCNLLACDVLLVGSSVARGQAAPAGKGWGDLLAEELRKRYGFQLANAAIPGTETTATLQAMKVALKMCKPCAVVIGLSLANEGLFLARDASEIDRVRVRFLDGMQKLAETAQASGALPVIGGVYPNDFYEPVHAQTLRGVEAAMQGWTASRGWKYISFLSALDDGDGRWRRGFSADPSHPNEEGHKAMFDAIDMSVFDDLVKRS